MRHEPRPRLVELLLRRVPCCSRGIDKSPAPQMLRICQSEPSRRGSTKTDRSGFLHLFNGFYVLLWP
ncbi:hypothetical protein QUF80_18160 [Desulfococcaceae bacterium HSG8]|nr:hypothetical protein [Desulfococcaceae bacterium HSG8]